MASLDVRIGLSMSNVTERVFEQNASNLLSLGLSVIPVMRRGKEPLDFMKGWQKYAVTLPTDEEIDEWAKMAPAANCGIVCGPASGIVCIDIDDNDLMDSPFIPKSPLVRRGKKGEARFFKYSPWMENFSIPGRIDFQANGRYIIIPPSVHADTGIPYRWTGEYQTMCTSEALPELTEEQIRLIQTKIAPTQFAAMTGRNEKLKSIASACLLSGKNVEETIIDLIEYDDIHHSPPLFTDPLEPYYKKMGSKTGAARRFASSIARSLGIDNPFLHIDQPIVTVQNKNGEKDFFAVNVPRPRSEILKKLHSTILSQGSSMTESIALATSLSILSTIIGNRFYVKTVYHNTAPNLLNLIVAGSGFGKNEAIVGAQKMLFDFDFVAPLQKTGSALMKDLSENKERLYVVDEVSQLFLGMKKAQNSSQAELCELMCSVFSSSMGVLLPPSTISSKRDKAALKITNPFAGFLCTTTGAGLANSVNQVLIEKGLLPRFLFFFQSWAPLWDEKQRPIDYSNELKNYFLSFIKEFPIIKSRDTFVSDHIDMREMTLDAEANEYYIQAYKDAHLLKKKFDEGAGNFEDNFIVRKLELVTKLACIDAISEGNTREINLANLQWAESVFDFSLSSVTGLVPIMTSTEYSRNKDDLLKFIKQKVSVTNKDVSNKLRHLNLQERTKMLEDLVKCGDIVRNIQKHRGEPGPGKELYSIAPDEMTSFLDKKPKTEA